MLFSVQHLLYLNERVKDKICPVSLLSAVPNFCFKYSKLKEWEIRLLKDLWKGENMFSRNFLLFYLKYFIITKRFKFSLEITNQ